MARCLADIVSRLALAVQRAGADEEGPVDSIHVDLMTLVRLIPSSAWSSPEILPERLAGAGGGESHVEFKAQKKHL